MSIFGDQPNIDDEAYEPGDPKRSDFLDNLEDRVDER